MAAGEIKYSVMRQMLVLLIQPAMCNAFSTGSVVEIPCWMSMYYECSGRRIDQAFNAVSLLHNIKKVPPWIFSTIC